MSRSAGLVALPVLIGLTGLIGPVGLAAFAQDPKRDLPPGAEGPLANDCFLPTAQRAGELLTRGDDALARARADLSSPRR